MTRENLGGYNLNISVERIDNRVDSFWYFNQDVAYIDFPNGRKLYAEARGEIQIYFDDDELKYKGINAVEEALDRGMNDDDLIDVEFIMNNWFVVVEVDIEGNLISDDLCVVGDYDEVIEMLKEIGVEKYKEYQL